MSYGTLFPKLARDVQTASQNQPNRRAGRAGHAKGMLSAWRWRGGLRPRFRACSLPVGCAFMRTAIASLNHFNRNRLRNPKAKEKQQHPGHGLRPRQCIQQRWAFLQEGKRTGTHRAPCSFPGSQTKILTRYRRHNDAIPTGVFPVNQGVRDDSGGGLMSPAPLSVFLAKRLPLVTWWNG